jgi:hypothetical protein
MIHPRNLRVLARVGFSVLLFGGSAKLAAQPAAAPDLGLAFGYAVLGTNAIPTTGTVTCTTSTINGDVGTTGASISNTGCTITGSTTVSLPLSGPGAVTDFGLAYDAIDVMNPDTACLPMPTASGPVPPGIYCSAASTTLGAGVIFTLSGSATDVWVFKVGALGSTGALTGNSFQMVMGGGAQACNVYWRTDAAATMTNSIFIGTILSGSAISVTGGSFLGRALATTDVTLTNVAPLTFAGCAAPAEITVSKDFIPNSPATVPIALTCSSGVVTTSPLNASEGAPAVFTVGAALPGATCQATEVVPVGYTADQTNCASVPLDGSCTIINTLASNTITVLKDFLPNNPAPVSIALTCSSGVVTTTPLNAAEGAPAVFTVTGALPGATCLATETVPVGYLADQTNCASVALGGTCTITNTLASNTITVLKDFLPNNPATVPIALTCTSGVVTATPLNAAEGAPAVFTVTGALPGATCQATETVPVGYLADQTNCAIVALGGSCTITNTLNVETGIPTLSGRSMILFSVLLALLGFAAIRRISA